MTQDIQELFIDLNRKEITVIFTDKRVEVVKPCLKFIHVALTTHKSIQFQEADKAHMEKVISAL
jgi:hypothetical protein